MKESTTQRQRLIDSTSKDEMVDVDYSNWNLHIMLLLLVSLSRQGKDGLTSLVQEYDAGKTKYSLQKEANLIKQTYMKHETAAQNIKNQLKSSIESKTIEELKRKPGHGQFNQDIERPSGDKGKSCAWLCRSALKGELENLIIAA